MKVFLFFFLCTILACKSELVIIKSNIMPLSLSEKNEFDSYADELFELKKSINVGSIPNFFYDDCFICNCFIPIFSTTGKIDCLESMLDSLNFSEISFLVNFKDSIQLKAVCKDIRNCKDENIINNTRWDKIQFVYRKKKLIHNRNSYFPHNAISNQSGIDTTSYYAFSYKTGLKGDNIHIIYKFNYDGTYKCYNPMDHHTNTSLLENMIQEGRFYINDSTKLIILENIYPNVNYSAYIIESTVLKLNKNGLLLMKREYSDSTTSNYLKGKLFLKYKKINFKNR